jgi:hypothetical protein
MPSSPCLSPMDAPLELYIEMGVFYLEESDSESCQSQTSSKIDKSRRRIIRKKSRK